MATKDQLEQEKLREEIELLKIQRDKLQSDRQASKAFGATQQFLPMATAIIAIVVSVTGIFTSAYSLVLQSDQAKRTSRENEAKEFRATLAAATDQKTPVEGRIASIWSLRTFWGTEQEITLVNALSTILVADGDDRLRIAAAEVIGTAYDERTPIAEKKRLAQLLYGNAEGEEGAVLRQSPTAHFGTWMNYTYDLKYKEIEAEKRVAIREAIRRNWEWLRGVHLRGADLRDGEFYNVDFAGSDLQDVNFDGANLCGSNFTGAQMGGIRLLRANLYNAKGLDAGDVQRALDLPPSHAAVKMSLERWRVWKAAGKQLPPDSKWSRWREAGYPVTSWGYPIDPDAN